MTSRRPTMNDVAHEAGVALHTVSRYVRGETNINPMLAERIAEAITRLGYRRNLAAASIRPGWTSRTIGLIISDLANPYYATLTRAVEDRAQAAGYLVVSASSDEDGGRHDRLVDRLMEQRIDALIVVPPRNPGRDWATVPPPVPPLVFVDRPVDYPQADVVLADNAGGARAAVTELLAQGATRIAFVGDSLAISTMRERHDGYVRALRDSGLDPDEKLLNTAAHSSEEAAAAVADLMRTANIDAVFAANNRAAVGALLAFRDAGRRLPLIGFDDFEAAHLSDPAVSVVGHDIVAMGHLAADIVLARLAGASEPPTTHVLTTTLILRGSEHP
jgi:LacI family transcriptional regulator